jgi:hypothetical protein
MFEPSLATEDIIERAFARMTKRRMSQVVAKRDRFGEILIEPKRAGDCPANAGNLKRVCQPRPVMVAFRLEKHLRFMLQAAKSVAMDYPVDVPLKTCPDFAFGFGSFPASGFSGKQSLRGQHLPLQFLSFFTGTFHICNSYYFTMS